MTIATRAELASEVLTWLDRLDDPDPLPLASFLRLAESRIAKRLRARCMQVRATEQLVDRLLQLPADWLEAVSLRLLASPQPGSTAPRLQRPLDPVSRQEAGSLTGSWPSGYVLFGDSIEIVPYYSHDVFAASYQLGEIEMLYYARPAPLVADDDSNAVLQEHPEIYLYATLMAATAYIKHDERLPLWSEAFEAAIGEANGDASRADYSGGRLRARMRAIG